MGTAARPSGNQPVKAARSGLEPGELPEFLGKTRVAFDWWHIPIAGMRFCVMNATLEFSVPRLERPLVLYYSAGGSILSLPFLAALCVHVTRRDYGTVLTRSSVTHFHGGEDGNVFLLFFPPSSVFPRKERRSARQREAGRRRFRRHSAHLVIGPAADASPGNRNLGGRSDVPADGGGANRNICTAYCIITIRTQAKIELTIRSEFLSETLKIHRRERRRAGPPPQVPTKLQNWKKKTQKRERQLSRKTEETNQNAANTDWTHEA